MGPDDSLNSIALKFNITPNKLVQLNKLFSRSVYPGQVRHCHAVQQLDDVLGVGFPLMASTMQDVIGLCMCEN